MANKTAAEKIDEVVNSPRSWTISDMSTTNQSIPDLIAADKHLARKGATSSAKMGVRLGVMRGPTQY